MDHRFASFCDGLAEAANRIGGPGFHRGLLDAWRDLGAAESGQVMYFDRIDSPRYLDRFETSSEVCRLYESEFGRWCPFYQSWRNDPRPGVHAIQELAHDGADYGDYFSVFYPKTGMVDEIGALLPVTRETAVGVFVERSVRFDPAEIESLRSTWRPFLELHRAHMTLLAERTMRRQQTIDPETPVAILDRAGREVSANEAWRRTLAANRRWSPAIRTALADGRGSTDLDSDVMLGIARLPARFPLAPSGALCTLSRSTPEGHDRLADFLTGRITPRERDIVGLILEGYPVIAIAGRLGLSENTIKSHRKRLYAKLDITTERELFVMYVDHLTRRRLGAATI
ncbi:MAG: LuxR C-terminal-related transcriptional regulator [Rhodospirillaceae bacterium]|nr:LuxR C-terminal-related transcriptional regulator [Rhodospirillaceae bacterium]